MPAWGLDRDQTVGSDLLLAVPRDERDIQVMCGGDVHGVGTAEPDLGSQLCRHAPQPTVKGHQAQFSESQEHLNSLVRELTVPRSSRDRPGYLC